MDNKEIQELFESAKRVVDRHDDGVLSNMRGDSQAIERLRAALFKVGYRSEGKAGLDKPCPKRVIG